MKAQGRLLGMKGRGESRTRRDEERRLLRDATTTGKAAALGNAEDWRPRWSRRGELMLALTRAGFLEGEGRGDEDGGSRQGLRGHALPSRSSFRIAS